MERNFKKMIRNYLPNIQVIVPSTFSLIKNLSTPAVIPSTPKNLFLLLPSKSAQGQLPKLPLFPMPIFLLTRSTMKSLPPSMSTLEIWGSHRKFPSPRKTDSIKG